MELWLIRHGEAEADVAGLYSGYAPTLLTGRSVAQMQTPDTLLRHVSVDNALHSELERARHTAQLILGDRKVPVRNMSELNEIFSGDQEMRRHYDLAREGAGNYAVWCNNWQNVTPTNGEGLQALSQRVECFAAQLVDYKTSQNLPVVSHQSVLDVLIARLLSMPAVTM